MLKQAAGNADAALTDFLQVLEGDPNCAEAYHGMGLAMQLKGEWQGALECFQYAIRFKTDFAEAYCNMGIILQKQGQLLQAEDYLRKAFAINPRKAEICFNLGSIIYQTEKYDEAESFFKKAVEINPQYAEAEFALAISLLRRGDFKNGFRGFEWRKKLPAVQGNFSQILQCPTWQGEEFRDKTLLIYPEQGYGDMLQFVRYLPRVKELGGRVVLAAPPELMRLLENLAGVDQVIPFSWEEIPDFSCDLIVSVMSLPYLIDCMEQDIFCSQDAYIYPDEKLVSLWRNRLSDSGEKKRIGLVWAGSPTNTADLRRSISLKEFHPIFSLEEFDWYSLQLGTAKKQLQADFECKIIDKTDEIQDFADTASFISHMDLVISVDTAVAHLAAAMGKNVWLLLGQAPDWRWGTSTQDTLWYPTMRIFRQMPLGEWGGVITQVRNSLLAEFGERKKGEISMGLRLNLGCGNNKIAGFIGVDKYSACNPDQVVDLEQFPWPWADNSVQEIKLNHVLEHLGQITDVYLNIFKEMWRVCQHDAIIDIVVPHPRHNDFISDPTHVRAITPEGIRLFSQKFNRKCIESHAADSTLGLYLGIDFDLAQVEQYLAEPWHSDFINKKISGEKMDEIARMHNNVIKETRLILKAVKA
jgi:hypothetical protein